MAVYVKEANSSVVDSKKQSQSSNNIRKFTNKKKICFWTSKSLPSLLYNYFRSLEAVLFVIYMYNESIFLWYPMVWFRYLDWCGTGIWAMVTLFISLEIDNYTLVFYR